MADKRRLIWPWVVGGLSAVTVAAVVVVASTVHVTLGSDRMTSPYWTEEQAFAGGPLRGNELALKFDLPAPAAAWPAVRLIGPNGPASLGAYRGKTLVVALWADWCAPCLKELPALARVNALYGNDKLAFVAVATGSFKMKTFDDVRAVLEKRHISGIPVLFDTAIPTKGLMTSLAGTSVNGGSLPSIVLIDPAGHVRARAIGYDGIDGKNIWESPAGLAFIKALQDGALA